MAYFLPFYFAYVFVVVLVVLLGLVLVLALYANAADSLSPPDVLTMKIKTANGTVLWDSEAPTTSHTITPGPKSSNSTAATFGIFTTQALDDMVNGSSSSIVSFKDNDPPLIPITRTQNDLILVAAHDNGTKNHNNDTKWKLLQGDISTSP